MIYFAIKRTVCTVYGRVIRFHYVNIGVNDSLYRVVFISWSSLKTPMIRMIANFVFRFLFQVSDVEAIEFELRPSEMRSI